MQPSTLLRDLRSVLQQYQHATVGTDAHHARHVAHAHHALSPPTWWSS
jgi:hypothetical protein